MYLAIQRCIDTSKIEIEGIAMVVTATLGVCFNIAMYFILHTDKCFKGVELKHHGHSHSGDDHGHSHGSHAHSNNKPDAQFTKTDVEMAVTVAHADHEEHSDENNINMRAAAIHVIGDFIQSVGVLIAAVIIYCKVKYKQI